MFSRMRIGLAATLVLAVGGVFLGGGVTEVLANVPTLVNYQGFLRDAGGIPINVPVNITFTIYNELNNPVWTESHVGVSVTEGSFNVLLGSNTPLDAGEFSGPERYLGISVNGDPELSPRARLASQPYAFRIETVDGATGGAISGDLNLDPSSPSGGNILKGGVPFIHNFGSDNTFLGIDAGNFTMPGFRNTSVGFNTLSNMTTGQDNTACGANALASNTSGGNNTAFGSHALAFNNNTHNNTAIGKSALYNNFDGYGNTACGGQALLANTIGDYNNAFGGGALQANTTGSYNTATGLYALANNISGVYNTASGTDAMRLNTIGDGNTATGVAALYNNTSGVANTASGDTALYNNIDGSYNTAIGRRALVGNSSGSYNTAIGYDAHVSTGALTNATAIGAGALVNASNKIRLGDAAVTILECQVGLTVVSDKAQKENFQSVDGNEVLKRIRGLNLSSWNLIGHDPEQFRHYGPMAQEFFAAFGHDGKGTIGTPTTINSTDMAGILMIAVQALERRTAEVEDLRTQVAELRAIITNQLPGQK